MKSISVFIRRFSEMIFLAALFFAMGDGAARLSEQYPIRTARINADVRPPLDEEVSVQNHIQNKEGNWGLSFQEEGKPPVANATADYLKQYDAYYAQDTDEKVLYLTFDAGYENGNTEAILKALKKHNAPAAFFLVGNYLETQPELVKQMVSDGHTVGNHTYHHPDMSKISTADSFQKELADLETLYQQVTGEPMKKFYRPPQGKYSEANLQMAKDLGYHTFFWSLAYVDWYEDKQPSSEEAFEKLLGRIHPGAIVLLHSTSKTNGEILDELLTRWENMGYRFGQLSELTNESSSGTLSS